MVEGANLTWGRGINDITRMSATTEKTQLMGLARCNFLVDGIHNIPLLLALIGQRDVIGKRCHLK